MIGNEREMDYVMIFGTINDILGYIYKTGSILKKANNYYDKSIIYLPRHCRKVTCESVVVWAKIGETLAVGSVGYYGLDY